MAIAEKTYPHDWVYSDKGDKPRWGRYVCRKCGRFAQFHVRFPVEEQTKNTCPL